MYEKVLTSRFMRVVTALPANPQDGDEIIFMDSLSAPTYRWHLRYNAFSASSYKWEYIGGTDVGLIRAANDNQTSNGTWERLNSPAFTVPVAGDWHVRMEAIMSCAASVYTVSLGLSKTAGTPGDGGSQLANPAAVSAGYTLTHVNDAIHDGDASGLSAGATLTMMLKQNAAVTTTWNIRRMYVHPIRVG